MATITDVNELNRLAQQATSDTSSNELPARPSVVGLPETEVTLPGGRITPLGEVIREAEVRELNGLDEEKLSRITSAGRLLSKILELGTVSIGEDKATPGVLDELLVGDRDALLVGIRIATYGADVEMELVCPHCEAQQETTYSLHQVPSVELEGERSFEVELKAGTAVVGLPTGVGQKAILSGEGKTLPELNTILLASCVESINDMPVGTDQIRRLGLQDRQALLKAITSRKVGPQLSDVKLACKECGEDIEIALTLAELFRL